MKNILRLLVMTVFVLPFSCSGTEMTPNPPHVTDADLCPMACENLKRLGCEEGQPIDTHDKCVTGKDCQPGLYCEQNTCHVTCDQFCREVEASGVWLDPKCVSEIISCGQVNGCPATIKK